MFLLCVIFTTFPTGMNPVPRNIDLQMKEDYLPLLQIYGHFFLSSKKCAILTLFLNR